MNALHDLKALVESGAKKEEIIKAIEKIQEEHVSTCWHIDDILGICEQEGIKCTRAQAIEIAKKAAKYHDAEYGINWGYLRDITLNHLEEAEEEVEA